MPILGTQSSEAADVMPKGEMRLKSFPRLSLGLPVHRLTRKELSLFCRQLSVMLQSGIPLLSALRVLGNHGKNPTLQDSICGVCTSLEAGYAFSEALGEYPKVFPAILVTMVKAGETGGALNTILDSVATFLEWEHRTREKIKTAVTYPIAVLILSLLAVSFLVVFILPVFARILTQMEVELPLITRLLMGISWFVKRNWLLLILLSLLLLGFGVRWLNHSTAAREKLDFLVLKLPLIGGMRQKIIISRFCKTLSTLLRSGVPLLAALEIVEKTAGNIVIEKSVAHSRQNIFEGQGMAGPLKETKVFTSVVIEMITVGEETGELALMLEKAGEIYDEEVDNYSGKIATVIEPLLICFVGAIVCVVLLSVFLPMFSVIGNVG